MLRLIYWDSSLRKYQWSSFSNLFTFLSGVFFGYYWLKKYLDFTLIGFFTAGFAEIKTMAQEYLLKNKTAK